MDLQDQLLILDDSGAYSSETSISFGSSNDQSDCPSSFFSLLSSTVTSSLPERGRATALQNPL